MFKAIGNFFRNVFGTPEKSVSSVPDKIEPPIVHLGPENVEVSAQSEAPAGRSSIAKRRQNQPEVAVPLLVEVNTAKVEPKKTTRKKAESKVAAKPKAKKNQELKNNNETKSLS